MPTTLRVLGILAFVGIGIVIYAVWGRSGPQVAPPSTSTKPIPSVVQLLREQPVKQIALEYHQPDLPPGPGREQFATQCVICHSPRYVLNQPIFPRKTWKAEVDKMIKAYGAPITPDQETSIVNYLVIWHGKEAAPAGLTQYTK